MVDVFADQVMTTFTSVGLLDEGKVIVLSARDHRMISIPIKDIQDVVKDQAFTFVLSTKEAQKNRSVLSQVVWNNDNSELQVIKSHHIDGQLS
jgi:diphthamide synthase subunit DPH2